MCVYVCVCVYARLSSCLTFLHASPLRRRISILSHWDTSRLRQVGTEAQRLSMFTNLSFDQSSGSNYRPSARNGESRNGMGHSCLWTDESMTVPFQSSSLSLSGQYPQELARGCRQAPQPWSSKALELSGTAMSVTRLIALKAFHTWRRGCQDFACLLMNFGRESQ